MKKGEGKNKGERRFGMGTVTYLYDAYIRCLVIISGHWDPRHPLYPLLNGIGHMRHN